MRLAELFCVIDIVDFEAFAGGEIRELGNFFEVKRSELEFM